MDSSELYHIKQQFVLGNRATQRFKHILTLFFRGAYKTLTQLTLPDPSSPDYTSTLLYKARAYIALHDAKSALQLIPEDTEDVSLKSAASLARYVAAADATEKEAALEELRDLSVEIEGDESEGSEREKAVVRVLAGTAFVQAGEIEEALETLGTDTEDLEAYVLIFIQLFCRTAQCLFFQGRVNRSNLPLNQST
jgi:coatomer protein complex subunit epsilon